MFVCKYVDGEWYLVAEYALFVPFIDSLICCTLRFPLLAASASSAIKAGGASTWHTVSSWFDCLFAIAALSLSPSRFDSQILVYVVGVPLFTAAGFIVCW